MGLKKFFKVFCKTVVFAASIGAISYLIKQIMDKQEDDNDEFDDLVDDLDAMEDETHREYVNLSMSQSDDNADSSANKAKDAIDKVVDSAKPYVDKAVGAAKPYVIKLSTLLSHMLIKLLIPLNHMLIKPLILLNHMSIKLLIPPSRSWRKQKSYPMMLKMTLRNLQKQQKNQQQILPTMSKHLSKKMYLNLMKMSRNRTAIFL